MTIRIERVHARRVWDSRGRPTVEVDVWAGGARGRAIAPAGASTGSGEAVDLRDGGAAFGGLDVMRAVSAVDAEISAAIAGLDVEDQEAVDRRMISLDGTANKSRLGGNAVIATSMAVAHAAAAAKRMPLWQHLAGERTPGTLPLPEIQIFGGGAHANRRVDVQDFMVVAVGADDFGTALDWTAEVYRTAGKMLSDQGRLLGVADEGGFWPAFETSVEALDFLLRAIERAGFAPGEDIAISLDIAASQLGSAGRYTLSREGRLMSSAEMGDMLLGWLRRYPIIAIEDPLAEDDLGGLARFTAAAGDSIEVVGDDVLCTDARRIREAAALGACNTALIKPNQIGTLTETREALEAARTAGWNAIVSARSGETEDVTIVHLAVGWGIEQLKVGSFSRSERMVKWNEGLRLAEELPSGGALPPRDRFRW
ncbi:MAG: phosphopyruvate hydratase [Hyphomicrobiaceae bacterium]